MTQNLNMEVSHTSREVCEDMVQHTNHFPLLTGEPPRANSTQAAGTLRDWVGDPWVQVHKAVGGQ